MKATVPLSADDLGGPHIVVNDDRFRVIAERDRIVVISFHEAPGEVAWFDDAEWLCCHRQRDPDTVKVVRVLSEDERKKYRIPLWIQGDEIPECCGQPMFFVGQIDDNSICTERPPDAQIWWHDNASFYVFTCPRCLGVKAVGQQF